MSVLAAVLGAYLVGSFPTAALVGGHRGLDPTASGSGNPGASNVYRLMGRRAGVLVLGGDVLKGVIAALLGAAVNGRAGLFACGAAAVVGHCAPAGRWRRGGKGVATAAGFGVVAFPWVGVLAGGVWFAVAKATGKASIASLAVMVAGPAAAALGGAPASELAVTIGVAALVVLRHWSNLGRLLRGQERGLN